MNRRGFLTGMAGILATATAPALVSSGILMPVRKLWTPEIMTLHVRGLGYYALGDLLVIQRGLHACEEIVRIIGVNHKSIQVIRAQPYHK